MKRQNQDNNSKVYPPIGLGAVVLLAMTAITSTANADMILGTELSPAMCAFNPAYRNLRQCQEKRQATVNFFRVTNQPCQNVGLKLSPLQESIVAKNMPDSYVRRQVWQNFGRCSGMSSANYFRTMTSLASNLRLPKTITTGQNYRLTKASFLQQLRANNPNLPVRAVNLFCQRNPNNQSILTYINTCYDNHGRYKPCAQTSNSCPDEFYILGIR